MNLKKKATSILIIGAVLFNNFNVSFADSARVVSLGTNLTQEQKETMLKYFNVNKDEAVIFEVNNKDERKYLEGIVPDRQIGNKTYSCAYVEPTSGNKINVKTVNLTYITSSIISSAITTATGSDLGGANIVVASPFPVSGTGGMVGVLMALEDATGEKLDEDKKELANEEMIITGEIGEDIGAEKASGVINSIKTEVIKNNTSDNTQIAEIINNVSNTYNITLNVGQVEKIQELMCKIGEQDYNYKEMKSTLENINKDINNKLDEMGEGIKTSILDTIKGWFTGFGEWFSQIFNNKEDLGILENTQDELLGENVNIDATTKDAINLPSSEEVQGFFSKIWNWFTGLFKNKAKEEVIKEDILFDNKSNNSEIEINEDLVTESSNDIVDSNTSNEENTEEKTDDAQLLENTEDISTDLAEESNKDIMENIE